MDLTFLRFRGLVALAFVIAILSVMISGVVEYWGMVRLGGAASDVRQGDTALANTAQDLREDLLQLRRYEKDVFMNVGSPTLMHQYKDKWDRVFASLWYDLAQTRHAGYTFENEQLQQITDRMVTYHVAFSGIFESIADGTIRTTQQANDQMSMFKESVHDAEAALADIGGSARHREPLLGSAANAQRFGLTASLLAFFALSVLFASCLRLLPTTSYAQ